MIEDLQKYNNDISDLTTIPYTRYENLFKVAKNNNYYFYNILKKIVIPENIDSRLFSEVIITDNIPYTTLSYRFYNTQDLWWLICIVNNIINPVNNITPGTKLKILKNDAVNRLLAFIDQNINN